MLVAPHQPARAMLLTPRQARVPTPAKLGVGCLVVSGERKLHRRPLPTQKEISPLRRYVVMLAFVCGGFAIGTNEFVSMGLLPQISADLGVPEQSASGIVTAYAFGVVIGAPTITAFTGRIPRRRLVLILMAAFVAGNVLTVLANNLGALMAARVIAGLPHGAYFSVTSLAAAAMAPRNHRGAAVAFVSAGLPIATIAGVPISQALGQWLGWAFAYGLVAVVGLITVILLWFLMPHMNEMPATNARTELGALKNSQVWLTLATGAVGFTGMFAVYTYVSFAMPERAGLDPRWMWLVLMTYGVGMFFGNALGGYLADRNMDLGILFALVAIGLSLVIYYFASLNPVAGTLAFGMIGMFGSSLVPSMQLRLIDVAGDAQTFANSLNHAALNTANGAGAAMGGIVVAATGNYAAPALAGATLGIGAVILWFPMTMLRKRQGRKAATAAG